MNGPSYTLGSSAAADEEAINWMCQSIESQASIVPTNAYGGKNAQGLKFMMGTPGLSIFSALPKSPVRGLCVALGRLFVVAGTTLYELDSTGAQTVRGVVNSDGLPASISFNGIQILIVSNGQAFCLTLATNVLVEVTSLLAGIPVKCDYDDTYFVVMFEDSNKYQMSQVLDGTTWPGQLVNEVSVFAGNISTIICNHRELGVSGYERSQVYQDTGSAEIFDAIPGALIEMGNGPMFSPALIDNSVFFVNQDARGARMCWRLNGYTPTRISTYAVEYDLAQYADISGLVSYSYQDSGHLFWVLYIPGAQWSWVFDVVEGSWHKRAQWLVPLAKWVSHFSWNHVYAFGMHLVGDWNTGNLYQMSLKNLSDTLGLGIGYGDGGYGDGGYGGAPVPVAIRRLRRSPTISDEMKRIFHASLTLDFDTGLGPQPPLLDGNGNPRAPQANLSWSDDRGKTWSNIYMLNCGMAGQYKTRAIKRRLGQSRYRVYQLSVTDPIPWTLVDAYLEAGPQQ